VASGGREKGARSRERFRTFCSPFVVMLRGPSHASDLFCCSPPLLRAIATHAPCQSRDHQARNRQHRRSRFRNRFRGNIGKLTGSACRRRIAGAYQSSECARSKHELATGPDSESPP